MGGRPSSDDDDDASWVQVAGEGRLGVAERAREADGANATVLADEAANGGLALPIARESGIVAHATEIVMRGEEIGNDAVVDDGDATTTTTTTTATTNANNTDTDDTETTHRRYHGRSRAVTMRKLNVTAEDFESCSTKVVLPPQLLCVVSGATTLSVATFEDAAQVELLLDDIVDADARASHNGGCWEDLMLRVMASGAPARRVPRDTRVSLDARGDGVCRTGRIAWARMAVDGYQDDVYVATCVRVPSHTASFFGSCWGLRACLSRTEYLVRTDHEVARSFLG